jgi:hypothetical protein
LLCTAAGAGDAASCARALRVKVPNDAIANDNAKPPSRFMSDSLHKVLRIECLEHNQSRDKGQDGEAMSNLETQIWKIQLPIVLLDICCIPVGFLQFLE